MLVHLAISFLYWSLCKYFLVVNKISSKYTTNWQQGWVSKPRVQSTGTEELVA